MAGRTAIYRGSLKSCNYRCSYCPFSKHRAARRELEKDKEEWLSFVCAFRATAREFGFRALLAAPYGEALVHPWYWEGLGSVSACPDIDAVGAQTNLSFPIQKSLAYFDRAGGKRQKLRLWATFHPEMTDAQAFAGRIKELTEEGILLCAGAVGVPENIALLRALRDALPETIYLWVNKMDGLKRPYTEEEKAAFLDIDPYFLRELAPVPADADRCRGRLFAEGDGKLLTCNISRKPAAEWADLSAGHFPDPRCGRRLCSCYLAYGGRDDWMNRVLFGPYPLFRIPRRPRAVFLDIEGTLMPGEKPGGQAQDGVLGHILAGLKALSLEKIPMFFATTLPYREAAKRCAGIWPLFSGGIFAGGAHVVMGGQQEFHFFDGRCLAGLAELKKKYHFHILEYTEQGKPYKATLRRARRAPWGEKDIQSLTEALPALRSGEIRYFAEGSCLQIVSSGANKAEGVRTVCRWMGIAPEEAAAAGDGAEDEGMLEVCRERG